MVASLWWRGCGLTFFSSDVPKPPPPPPPPPMPESPEVQDAAKKARKAARARKGGLAATILAGETPAPDLASQTAAGRKDTLG